MASEPGRRFHGKLVRVYPERSDPRTEFIGGQLPAHIDYVKEAVAFALARGYPSGTVCKVVMVSRMGDVGLTKRLRAMSGYDLRVDPECLEEVPESEEQGILRAFDEGEDAGDGPQV